MQELINQVKSIVSDEYGRASQKFGPTNNSDHESYAVIKEEMEEAYAEINYTQHHINNFWQLVKDDAKGSTKQVELTGIMNSAIAAASELIQVAAMAYKAKVTNSCLNEKAVKSDVSEYQEKDKQQS